MAILLCTLQLPAAAQAIVPQDLAKLVDPGGTETLASVSADAAAHRFQRVRNNDLSAGYTHDVYWLRFTLQVPAPGAWWLDVQPAVLDDLRLFEPVAGGHRLHHTGDMQAFAMRALDYRGFVFKLDLPDTAPRTFYLRIQTESSMQARLTLWHPNDFYRNDRQDATTLGLYFGACAVLLLGNLTLWATLRHALFGWFSLVVASYALIYCGRFGLTAQLLPDADPRVANFLLVLGIALGLGGTTELYRHLLRVPARKRWLHMMFRVQFALAGLIVPAWFVGWFPQAMTVAVGAFTLFVPLLLLLALRQWRARRPDTRAIALGNVIALAGSGIQTLGHLGVQFSTPVTYNLHLYTSAGMLIAMQIGLSTRILATNRQRTRLRLRAQTAELRAASEQTARVKLAEVSGALNALVDELHHAQRLGKIGNWEWLLANDTFQGSEETWRMFGWEAGRGAPQPLERAEHFTPDSWPRLNEALSHTLRTGQAFVVELELAPGAGRASWIEGRGTLVVDAAGRPVKLRGTVRDISDSRRLIQAQSEAAAMALASRSRDEFLARVSHEMRTPLNAMSGMAQLLALDPKVRAAPELADQVGMLRGAADHLRSMIDDVLDLAQIRAGSLRLDLRAISIQALATECLRWMGAKASLHQVSLRLVDARQGWWLVADQTRMRQVLINLLSNAIKYNRRGGKVVMTLHHEPAAAAPTGPGPAARPPAAGWICIEVADTGKGLSPQQLEALFQPFNRLGAELSDVEGTGLGLSLVKELTEAMGGTLSVHSVQGQGAQFSLRLPADVAAEDAPVAMAPATAKAPDATLDVPGAPFRLLYVEDNRLNVMVVRLAMKRLPGVVLHVATDGSSGLAMARQLRPDLILLDINLPQLSGIEVVQQLRADPALAHTPCVAVSANSIAADVERAIDAGFDDYIAKPIEVQALLQLVQRMREGGHPWRISAHGALDG
ncbi:MAG: 7TM-DISM domain-containing protein [Aquabacterium sp.]|nr:7TM-DISM domain-containing protein [Aquabacterium sp.]